MVYHDLSTEKRDIIFWGFDKFDSSKYQSLLLFYNNCETQLNSNSFVGQWQVWNYLIPKNIFIICTKCECFSCILFPYSPKFRSAIKLQISQRRQWHCRCLLFSLQFLIIASNDSIGQWLIVNCKTSFGWLQKDSWFYLFYF